jgi:peptidoglycan/xylan/chitin deacetylase (PgdA/CDA1 family)
MQHVALTFDDGPSAWSEPILDILAANGVQATFFMIGCLAEESLDLLERMVSEGHEIGNHTWSHPWLARDCDDERVLEELQRTNIVLDALSGVSPNRFRAPHYDVDERVAAIAARLGLAHTRGDIAPADWHQRSSAPVIATFVLQQVRHGAVVGLHDGIPPNAAGVGSSRQPTVDAVAAIVPRLRERGYECVTASALLGSGDATGVPRHP